MNFFKIVCKVAGCLIFLLLTLLLKAQSVRSFSTPQQRQGAYDWRNDSNNSRWAGEWPITNIGPTIMSGRITDIDVNPDNPLEFYIAYASGGLWYTENNGTTFTPLFDHEAVMTIGDIAVHWPSHTLYIGTGECNSSRSSYAGNGVYKSTDKGKTWKNTGLPDSHHIGKLWVDPMDPSRVIVAALGHLYTTHKERGIFITGDGGLTWEQTLFVNDTTGVVDLIADPLDKNTFYCASWHRIRKAWNFTGSGNASAIYKSTDGGRTWKDISLAESGFPRSVYTGRIGLSVSQQNGSTVLYAIVDNQKPMESKKQAADTSLKEKLRQMSTDSLMAMSDEKINQFLADNEFPEKYNAKEIKKLIKKGKLDVKSLVEYLEDANLALFDTEIAGAEVYVSRDGGKSWSKTHTEPLNGLYYTYGYYFGQITAQPDDARVLYILGVPLLKSEDGGKTWKDINGDNQHGDHHVLQIHPKNPKMLYNGNDGGLNISYDAGLSWIKCSMPAVGQFYAIQTDDKEPYNVYGGLQDNGVWTGSSQYSYSTQWQSNGKYPYEFLMGGDGMQVQIDPRDAHIVYTGFQFGNYYRIDRKSGKRKFITPKHELGDRPYRFNWQSPILLSRHQPDIVYLGANKLLRSFDQGDHFKSISGDLTNGGKKGNVPYGTLTTIDESPLVFGMIYTGSDDGKICLTRDGGQNWDTIGRDLPANLWVSRIVSSRHLEGRVYVSLNGYRNDDFNAYVFKSDDYGKTWSQIGINLPHEAVNVIREDPEDENLLYVGTDHGLYFSIDGGSNYQRLCNELPNVPVHDLVVQQRGKELIVGTHGRSLFKVGITHLRRLGEWADSVLVITDVQAIAKNNAWGKKTNVYTEVRQPKARIGLFSKEECQATITIQPEKSDVQFKKEIKIAKGLSVQELTFWFDTDPNVPKAAPQKNKKGNKGNAEIKSSPPAEDGKYYPAAGNYIVKIKSGQKEVSGELKVEIKK